ncbi:MAG: TMEM14 family protein [Candidatus Methylacidiphilales bacterium]|nr:TMEM14 family protein [Candidatus Methylacidiphilales bacterium]
MPSIGYIAGISLLLYGISLIAGGLVGYLKAKSTPSLVAGLVSGTLALFLYAMYGRAGVRIGVIVLCCVLASVMGQRYRSSRKWMPAGFIATFSAIVAILHLLVILLTGEF